MKKLIVAATALFGFLALTGAAIAADPAEPATDWSGFYIGLNAGYAFTNADFDATATSGSALACGPLAECPTSSAVAASRDVDADGFIGGLQVGVNYQMDSIVAGLEADIQFLDGQNTATGRSGPILNFGAFEYFAQNRINMDLLGTLRARLGFLASPNVLLYATGGLAYGDGNARTVSQLVPPGGTANLFNGARTFRTLVGPVVAVSSGWQRRT